MLGDVENRQILKKATHTAIQGFPTDKKDVTIYEMIEEQLKDDQKRLAAMHRKQHSEIRVKSDNLLSNKSGSKTRHDPNVQIKGNNS